MPRLQDLSKDAPIWNLDEFVAQVNALLPDYLPEDGTTSRTREEVNPRLVRHYATLGMLDEPLRAGREVRYEYRHLLQLLVVRRLLAEGFGANAIGDLARLKSNGELEAILEGGAQLTVAPANPALAYLEQIKNRAQGAKPAAPGPQATPAPPPATPAPRERETRWTRYELLPGVELHVNDDFAIPKSRKEQENLLQAINLQLIRIQQRREK